MIHPYTVVQVLDIQEGEPIYGGIFEIFQKYSMFAKTNSIGEEVIQCGEGFGPLLKITDWTGWTDIISITKFNVNPDEFYSVAYTKETETRLFRVTVDELLPIYSIDKTQTGFHGEVKYRYTLTDLRKFPDKPLMRVLKLPNGEQFVEVKCSDKGSCTELNSAFRIETKSKFYNGNNFHLWGSSELPISEVEKWYK